jgi:hypothetical protein
VYIYIYIYIYIYVCVCVCVCVCVTKLVDGSSQTDVDCSSTHTKVTARSSHNLTVYSIPNSGIQTVKLHSGECLLICVYVGKNRMDINCTCTLWCYGP